jgi:molecular chaperone HtpG
MAAQKMTSEKLEFQAEVKQLMQLMIHSLYSNKEIVLRELISNASDAADKLRFEALANSALYENDSDLKITIGFDKAKRTVTISDNGIGMSRDEVVANIGTIAKSGTKEFMQKMAADEAIASSGGESQAANLIGQFGVGFYSAFIIADKVTLITRRAGSTEAVKWQSAGEGDYTIEAVKKESRGTEITLHLRKDEDEFLNDWQLKSIIRKYSDHITLPIMMQKSEWKEGVDGKGGEMVLTDEFEAVNKASALWARSKNDITTDEYNEFYKHVSHDYLAPLAYTHSRVEGKQEYISLLYIPSKAPFDLYDRERRHGIKLYVKRVFIMEDAEKLMPQYLRFVRGVIDSADLPLNISREILQDSRDVDAIKNGSVKKVLSLLEDMAKDKPEDYAKFWAEFGRVLKEGPGEDFANKDKIASLLRFASTRNEHSADAASQSVSLKDYVEKMQPEQAAIYYITADTFAAAQHSPHLEIFRKKNIEVLLLSDKVDEWLLGSLTEFEGKKLQSIAKGDLDLGALETETEKEIQKKIEEEAKTLIERVKSTLGDAVKEVRVTHRLTDSPACLVAGEHDLSGNMARILKAAGQNAPESKPILELNPTHKLVKRLENEAEEVRFNDLAHLVFDQALLAEGGQLNDPASFVRRMNSLLV